MCSFQVGLLVAIDCHESHERVLPHQIDPRSGSHGQSPIKVKVDAAAMTVEHWHSGCFSSNKLARVRPGYPINYTRE